MIVGLTALGALPIRCEALTAEKVFILMSTQFFHPAIAGICLAGILAAIMSTASAQLLLVVVRIRGRFLSRPVAQPRRPTGTAVGRPRRGARVAIIAFIGLDPDSTVLRRVGWAWAGFGAAFGPAIVLSLVLGAHDAKRRARRHRGRWPHRDRLAALEGELFALYELVPGFVLSWLAIWVVSITARGQGEPPAAA